MSESVEKTDVVPKPFPAEGEAFPRLRFPGHSTQWQRIALRELLTEPPSYGLNAPATEHRANLPLYLRITDIDENGRYLRDGRASVAQAVTSDAYLQRGDIAVARTGASVGKSYFCDGRDGPFVYAGFLIRLRANPNKLLPSLLAQWLRSDEYWRWVTLTSARSGQPGINGTEYASAAMPLPTGSLALKEQRKIAECLESLDELIAAETEKLDALRRHQKGLLQQLFPVEGETTPRLRLPQFRNSGEWKPSALSAMATFSNGRAYSTEELLQSGKYRVLRVGNFFTNQNWFYSDLELGEDKYCVDGDLLYAWSASFGPRIWRGEKVIYHYHIWKVLEKEGVYKPFLHLLLGYETERMKSMMSNGSGMMHLTKEGIESWESSLPRIDEQKSIAAGFMALERTSEALLSRLDYLKAHKVALMQQLFPSTVEIDDAKNN